MSNLETIFIIYIIVVNVLGIITIIMLGYANKKVSDTLFTILFGIAIPITLPLILYLLTFDKLKRRKRKQDLEQQFDDMVKENKEKENER